MAIPTWVDTATFETAGDVNITAYGRDAGWTTQRGTTSLVTTGFVANAGTYQESLNNRTRLFDPNHATGTYFGQLVPGVPFQKVATWPLVAGTAYEVFTGQADDWPQEYPSVGFDQVVPFNCTDAIGFFSGCQFAEARPAETSGTRITAIVNASGWPGATDIDTGVTVVGPLHYGVISAWSHMTDIANAEWGDLYIAADGTLVFRDRNRIVTETRSIVSQHTFVDTGTTNKYADVKMTRLPIVNDCTITYNDQGAQVNGQDATSILRPWGVSSLSLSLPIQSKAVAQQYANWLVYLYKNPITTFSTITIKPGRDATNLFPQILGRELSDLITVTRTPLGGGTAITRDCWIRGIAHSYADHVWTSTTFALQDASWVSSLARFDADVFDGAKVFAF